MANKGLTLIEILIVVALISILTGMAVTVSKKFAERKSIDGITHKISSALATARIRALRSGVEFKIRLNFNDNNLTITTSRGYSNRGSKEDEWEDVNSLNLEVPTDYTIALSTTTPKHEIEFNPNGTGSAGSIHIKPYGTDPGNKQCSRIIVWRTSRIRTETGNWNKVKSECKIIKK